MINFRVSRLILTASLALSVTCIALAQPDRIGGPIDRSWSVVVPGNAHPKAQMKYDQGPVEASFRLGYISMMLKQTAAQAVALDQLLADQQNPASFNYRQW